MDANSTVEKLTPYADQYFNNIFNIAILLIVIAFYYYYKNKHVKVFVKEIRCPKCNSEEIEGALNSKTLEVEAVCKKCKHKFNTKIDEKDIKSKTSIFTQIKKDFKDFKQTFLGAKYKEKK